MLHSRHRFTFRTAAFTLIFAMVMAACGGSSQSGSAPQRVDVASISCKPVANSGLGTGDVCVDSGIRSSSLFSFANWGGRRYKADDFGFPEMIALYGEKVVCEKEGGTKCDVTPKARLMRNVIDAMLQNGRCEGMTSLGAMYMTSRGPDPKAFKADGIQNLTPAVDEFGNVLDYWWSTQFLSNVVNQSKASRKTTIEEVLGQIVNGLSNKSGVTVGLYANEGAHSVLPVAVTRSAEDKYIVHVWDSNNPRGLGRIQFDLTAQEWAYAGGRVNTSSAAKNWTGGNGTIDAVTLESRQGSPLMNIETKQRGDATITASSSAARSVNVVITTNDGKKLIATTTGTTGAIPGATVTPMRNGDTNQLVITLPQDSTAFSVKVTSDAIAQSDDTGTTQLTIDNGTARALSLSLPNKNGEVAAVIESSVSTGGQQSYKTSSDQATIVTASTDSSVLNIPVKPQEVVTVEQPTSKASDALISIDPTQGATQTIKIATPTNGGTQDVVVARGTDGGLVAVANPLSPIAVDREALATITAASATKSESKSQAQITPAAAESVSAMNFTGAITETTVTITSRVTSDQAVSAFLEYGQEDNWNETFKTAPQSIAAGVDVNMKSTLSKLTPGTAYRYRTVIDVDGFLVYSPYGTFTTTGTAPDELNAIVSDASIKVSSTLVASTATGGVISSRITTPVASTAWIEYSAETNPGEIMKTNPQDLRKGTAVSLISVLNGLSIGQTYRYRVVVNAKGVLGASSIQQLTTGSTVATEKLAVTAVGATFSFSVADVQTTTATVNVITSSESAGRVAAEISAGDSANSTKSKTISFVVGKNIKTSIPFTGLQPGVQYRVRLLVNVGSLTQYSTYQTFRTAEDAANTIVDKRFGTVEIPTSSMRETEALLKVAVDSADSGNVFFEYSVNNESAVLLDTARTPVTAGKATTVSIDTNPTLRAGTPYRVRAVLDTGKTQYRSAFSTFTTPGTLNVDNYKASAPGLQRTSVGANVSWSIGVPDVPSAITFKVFDGSTVLCTTSASTLECGATITTFGVRSIVVASFFNGVEITRGPASTISIGGTPTVSAFSFVSATSNSLAFTYSFNPQGETVQYGIEIRTAQDVFVKADLGGQTSGSQNGVTHQVSGLTTGTTYKARLILAYGTQVVSSAWVTVSTQ